MAGQGRSHLLFKYMRINQKSQGKNKDIMKFQTVLFDFDGVLCKERFYQKTLRFNYPEVYDWIQTNIFGNKELVRKWMRNQVNSDEINKIISESIDIERSVLTKLYNESIRMMELEKEVKNLAELLKSSGYKIGIVTDNMDVFTRITVPNKRLDFLFDSVVNSADYGTLKKENNGKLFDIALDRLEENIENSIMIDDSEKTIELYKQKGGYGIVYQNATELKSLLSTML